MKDLVSQFMSLEIDSSDPKYSLLSNYNKFQSAKLNGTIETNFEELLGFLKYECLHANRALIKARLINLTLTAYKEYLRKHLLEVTKC